jgi:2'-5' RNA ligase
MPWGSYDESLVANIRVPHFATGYGSFENVQAKVDAVTGLQLPHKDPRLLKADAEQAKETGGMIALYPRVDDALQMHVDGGEDVQELHVTLCYLGEDVSGMDPGNISLALSQITDSYTPLDARVMGHATFNPDGGPNGEQDPCAVYIISDSPDLDHLHRDVLDACHQEFDVPTQHAPYIPHLTVGYGLDANRLTFTGAVTFDRIGLRFRGQSRDFPFVGS